MPQSRVHVFEFKDATVSRTRQRQSKSSVWVGWAHMLYCAFCYVYGTDLVSVMTIDTCLRDSDELLASYYLLIGGSTIIAVHAMSFFFASE
jgi:hypothetical protein